MQTGVLFLLGVRMKSGSTIARWILVVVAACSLVSMFALLQVDSIVNQSLYSLGSGLVMRGQYRTGIVLGLFLRWGG